MEIVDGQPITTSLKVAEFFGRDHKEVLRAIANLDCSKSFTERNFALSEYTDKSGKSNKMYTMTKDGFTFLVMGFRGKKAAEFKESYIDAFNKMEKTLTEIANKAFLIAFESERRTLLGTIREQEQELQVAKEEKDCYKRLTELRAPVHEFGEISKENGLPKTVFRSPTYAAQPRTRTVVIPEDTAIQLRLGLM